MATTTKHVDITAVWGALADLLKALTRLANAAADQVEQEKK